MTRVSIGQCTGAFRQTGSATLILYQAMSPYRPGLPYGICVSGQLRPPNLPSGGPSVLSGAPPVGQPVAGQARAQPPAEQPKVNQDADRTAESQGMPCDIDRPAAYPYRCGGHQRGAEWRSRRANEGQDGHTLSVEDNQICREHHSEGNNEVGDAGPDDPPGMDAHDHRGHQYRHPDNLDEQYRSRSATSDEKRSHEVEHDSDSPEKCQHRES